jgi:hypothetical protein
MSTYQQKDMSGSLFRNDKKETDSHPDYKGSALLGGVDHWLDAWINESASGTKYMSLKFKPKEGARGVPNPPRDNPQAQRPGFDPDDSDVPF